MWVAICPKLDPPQACSIAALSMIRLTALRTWTSSNGGVAQFIVMYVVTSPESKWIRFFLAGCVRYCCRIDLGGWLVNEASRLPDCTLLKMSLTLVSMLTWMPSTLLVRRSSVALVKHLATSWGIGAVAAIDRRYRKSPVGLVRWKMIVVSSGVSMPEIGAGAGALPSMPLMTP